MTTPKLLELSLSTRKGETFVKCSDPALSGYASTETFEYIRMYFQGGLSIPYLDVYRKNVIIYTRRINTIFMPHSFFKSFIKIMPVIRAVVAEYLAIHGKKPTKITIEKKLSKIQPQLISTI